MNEQNAFMKTQIEQLAARIGIRLLNPNEVAKLPELDQRLDHQEAVLAVGIIF